MFEAEAGQPLVVPVAGRAKNLSMCEPIHIPLPFVASPWSHGGHAAIEEAPTALGLATRQATTNSAAFGSRDLPTRCPITCRRDPGQTRRRTRRAEHRDRTQSPRVNDRLLLIRHSTSQPTTLPKIPDRAAARDLRRERGKSRSGSRVTMSGERRPKRSESKQEPLRQTCGHVRRTPAQAERS